MSFKHALKWSFLSELATKAISPVVFVILAKLLTPEDFGVMAAAQMVMVFSQIFWEAGMGKALIRRQTDPQEAANAAFWINIGLGVIIVLLLYSFSGLITRTFFHDDRVIDVLHVMTIQIFLGAFGSVHTALLKKEMKFKSLFWVRFTTVGFPGMASIPLALSGMGYWSLVFGTLTGQFVQVIMLWNMSRWRPQFSFHTKIAKEMVRFGTWVGISGLLSWFYAWADSLIIGMYLGAHDLGLYRTGNQFSSMIYGMIFGPVMSVLYSHLSRVGDNREKLQDLAKTVIKILTFTSISIGMAVFSLSTPLGEVVFGEKWFGVGFIIGVMALMHGYSWVVGMNGEFYRAMNKPSYETIVTATTLVIYLGSYLYFIRFGLETFVWVRLALALGALLVHLFVLKRLLNVALKPIAANLGIVTLFGILAIVMNKYIVVTFVHNSWLQIIIGLAVCSVSLGLPLFLIERNGLVIQIKALIQGRKK